MRDIQFHKNNSTTLSEVMTTDLITAPEGNDLTEATQILRSSKKGKLVIVDKNEILTIFSLGLI